MGRRLSPDEAELWGRVMATVTPLSPSVETQSPVRSRELVGGGGLPQAVRSGMAPTPNPALKGRGPDKAPGTTLDASWDRRLARGAVEPDATVDLHGHTLASAHALLDAALDRAHARGDRVILLVTGKPPRGDHERPPARGAIRAAVGDWLHASRHAGAIAAVRGASPRHGGAGALYIVLRRPRTTPKS